VTGPSEQRPSSLARGEGERPVPSTPSTRAPRRRRLRRRAVVAVATLVLVAAATARVLVWPSLPPVPRHVDAIIELAGPTNRDEAAIELARQHLAPLLIQSTVPGDATDDGCLAPIPGVTIECFAPHPATTRGEARYIGSRAAAEHWSSIVLVTTPDHAWRARLRVQRCFPGQVYVSTSPLPTADWILRIPYQWAAIAKAELLQRDC
jgi:hypothetical protein